MIFIHKVHIGHKACAFCEDFSHIYNVFAKYIDVNVTYDDCPLQLKSFYVLQI